jgi:hypothetical protein
MLKMTKMKLMKLRRMMTTKMKRTVIQLLWRHPRRLLGGVEVPLRKGVVDLPLPSAVTSMAKTIQSLRRHFASAINEDKLWSWCKLSCRFFLGEGGHRSPSIFAPESVSFGSDSGL